MNHTQQPFQNQEIDALKKWSNKNKFIILFDSDIDGNGVDIIDTIVLNKSQLYFITFDHNNNAFGGYVNTIINKKNCYIQDKCTFVFSLIRNGKVNITKYSIQEGEKNAFYMNSGTDFLYGFGIDIGVFKINCEQSFCFPDGFNYNKESIPFVDKNFPQLYSVKRIIIVEMI